MFEIELAARGITCKPGASNSNKPRNVSAKKRGFWPNVEALTAAAAVANVPSLQSQALEERHLACWLIRIQAGILPGNYVPLVNTKGIQHQAMAGLIRSVSEHQSVNDLAHQWNIYCLRLHFALRSQKRGTGWADVVSNYTQQFINQSYSADRLALRRKRVISPIAIIEQINTALSTIARPVSFSTQRQLSWELEQRFRMAGLEVTTLPLKEFFYDDD